jgi:hypothetical protein
MMATQVRHPRPRPQADSLRPKEYFFLTLGYRAWGWVPNLLLALYNKNYVRDSSLRQVLP